MEHIFLDSLYIRYPVLAHLRENIYAAFEALRFCCCEKKTIFLAGNGGSKADADHFAGELLKGFRKKRPIKLDMKNKLGSYHGGSELTALLQEGISAVSLGNSVLSTAIVNDVGAETVFAQPLYALGREGDVFVGISTSGNAKNIYNAAITARALEMKVITLTGKTGGILLDISDVCINVPETETYKIQELHLPIYHAISAQLEEKFFD